MCADKADAAADLTHDKYRYRYSWLHLIRPMTLTGTINPVIVGTILAAQYDTVRYDVFTVMLIAAVLVQSATNIFNDFFDFLYGQDQDKWILEHQATSRHGPFHHKTPYIALSMLGMAAILGLWLAMHSSVWIILVGAIGIIAGYKYSAGKTNSLSAIGLGEGVAAIFLGFVPGTVAFVVQGQLLNGTILAIFSPFALLISSMILTNNIRDIDKDHGFRHTIAIRLGRQKAVQLLTALLILAYVAIIILLVINALPRMSLVTLLASPAAVRLLWSLRRKATRAEEKSSMKWAAWHHWLFSLLLICGLLIGCR